jgi:FAD:protein FMN transferase
MLTFDAIGTRWEIETHEPLSPGTQEQILARVRRFDATYSRFRPDSLVARIAAAPAGGRFEFPDDAIALFDLYDHLHAGTGGAVDPLVGAELERLGYDAAYSLEPDQQRAFRRVSWDADVRRDGTTLVTRRPLVIDVGAAGKGHLVDLITAILQDRGHANFIVDGSGDLRHTGERPIRVGLEHPLDPQRVIGVANLRDAALCASASNRRAWGDGLHHLLDARTGTPARDVIATWAVADTAAVADGLATALFFAEPQELCLSFEYARVLADGRLECSETLDAGFWCRCS